MDGSKLVESLDFLWFFTNVLSPRTHHHQPIATKEDDEEEERPKPIFPIDGSKRIESPKAEALTPRCIKCGELISSPGFEPEDNVEVEVSEPRKEEEIKRKKRRTRRRRSQRKILGELDLGFERDRNCYYKDYSFGVFDDEKTGYGNGSHQAQEVQERYKVKMPPLNDGLAMKEHLKSWAYAVACTVK